MTAQSKITVALLYLFVTISCVGVSTYSSIIGFWSLLEYLAIPVALVIGAALLASDYVIKDRVERNGRLLPAMLMLAIAMSGSVVSNFNYFYTNAIRGQALVERLDRAFVRFDENITVSLSALRKLPQYKNREEREKFIRSELESLRQEALDPGDFGIGPQSKEHIARIEEQLQRPLADVAYPNPDTQTFEIVDQWIVDFETRVYAQLAIEDETSAVFQLRQALEARRALLNDEFEATAGDPEVGDNAERQVKMISEWQRQTNVIQTDLNATIGEAIATGRNQGNESQDLQVPQLRGIDAVGTELGTIYYSLEDGFVNRTDIGVTLFSIAASILIDIIPLMFGVLLIGARHEDFDDDDDILAPHSASADIDTIN